MDNNNVSKNNKNEKIIHVKKFDWEPHLIKALFSFIKEKKLNIKI